MKSISLNNNKMIPLYKGQTIIIFGCGSFPAEITDIFSTKFKLSCMRKDLFNSNKWYDRTIIQKLKNNISYQNFYAEQKFLPVVICVELKNLLK